MRDQTTWLWNKYPTITEISSTNRSRWDVYRGGERKKWICLHFLFSLGLLRHKVLTRLVSYNLKFRLSCIHLPSGMWDTCCTPVASCPVRRVYTELKWKGRTHTVTGCIWMDSCSCDELLQKNLPPASCFLRVATAMWCICMPQTLLLLLTWLLHADSWMHIRACTHTLDPKAATVGDYQQRKWLLKCLSPTHTALDPKNTCG